MQHTAAQVELQAQRECPRRALLVEFREIFLHVFATAPSCVPPT